MKRTQRQFLKHYERYIKLLLQIEKEAESVDVIEEHLDHLLQLIEPEFEHPRVVYGLILLDDKKPWCNLDAGLSSLKEVAERGDLFGQYSLGTVYKEGRRGLPEDPILGKYWREKAVEGGWPKSQSLRIRLGSSVSIDISR